MTTVGSTPPQGEITTVSVHSMHAQYPTCIWSGTIWQCHTSALRHKHNHSYSPCLPPIWEDLTSTRKKNKKIKSKFASLSLHFTHLNIVWGTSDEDPLWGVYVTNSKKHHLRCPRICPHALLLALKEWVVGLLTPSLTVELQTRNLHETVLCRITA